MNSLNNTLINNKKLVFSARKCYTYNPAFNIFPLISFEDKRWYYRKKKDKTKYMFSTEAGFQRTNLKMGGRKVFFHLFLSLI